MRTIKDIHANDDWTLTVTFADGTQRVFDVKPLLGCEAFSPLRDPEQFRAIHNRGYFIAWDCEADLSADTLFHEGTVH
ncbi:MAG: DUF2442 domain-containing protein [Desulfuromonadales bacterium]|nr:DUF2442 domain-containing protein [Desulfuromonadales bacterium]